MIADDHPAALWRLSWADMHRDARVLAGRLRGLGPFDGIVAVARGGLIPAAILAAELDIKLVETVCVSSYDQHRRGAPRVLKALAEQGRRWLVVDDLVDSGATARLVRAMLPDAHYAVLYAKPAGRALADSHVAEVAQEVWVVFPWEEAPAGVKSP